MPAIKSGKKTQLIQGRGTLPFAKPMVEEPCPPGEHVERLYFPEIDPAEANPFRRVEKMKEAGADPFEVAAVEHNIKLGHITHGRQISRGATLAELNAGLPGNHQHIKAVCVKCGQFREVDHASDRKSSVECKNQTSQYGQSDQFKNNKILLERGYDVAYKVPASKQRDKKINALRDAGFDVIFVRFN
jgi:hypothetical protein